MKVVPGDVRFPDMNFIELAIVSCSKRIRLERDLCKFLEAAYDGIDAVSYTHLTLPTNREV